MYQRTFDKQHKKDHYTYFKAPSCVRGAEVLLVSLVNYSFCELGDSSVFAPDLSSAGTPTKCSAVRFSDWTERTCFCNWYCQKTGAPGNTAATYGLSWHPGEIGIRIRIEWERESRPVCQLWVSEGRPGIDSRVREGVNPAVSPMQIKIGFVLQFVKSCWCPTRRKKPCKLVIFRGQPWHVSKGFFSPQRDWHVKHTGVSPSNKYDVLTPYNTTNLEQRNVFEVIENKNKKYLNWHKPWKINKLYVLLFVPVIV